MKVNKQITSKELADFKRLLEYCMANPVWRKEFLSQPETWLEKKGLQLDVKTAVEAISGEQSDQEREIKNPYLLKLQEEIDCIHEKIRTGLSPEHMPSLKFRKWYGCQSRKYFFSSALSRKVSKGFYHIPFAFELNDGCSGGCSFCCFSAEKLRNVWRHTEENAKTWREILKISKKIAGDMTAMGICYMATEPFDNPDYELFLKDFKEVLGRYPQTTTAMAHRQVKRIKEFMKELGEESLSVAGIRFSITSLEQLMEIYKCYTPWELRYVELLMNNPESVNSYSKSGRSIQLSETLEKKNFMDDISSACACGFVINLAKQTITLEAPHKPDEKHPLGIKIYEECTFQGSEDYQKKVEYLIDKWMPESLPFSRMLKLADGVECVRKGYVLSIRGDGISSKLSVSEREYQSLVRLLEEEISLSDLYRQEDLNEFEKMQLETKLNILYDKGCIEDY